MGSSQAIQDRLGNYLSTMADRRENLSSYAQCFLDAIGAGAQKTVEDAQVPSTINCQITAIPESADSNVYKVSYRDNELKAITVSKTITYEVGQTVSALVPDGNFDNNLVIIGLYSTAEEETMSDEEYYEQVSPNLISNIFEDTFQLQTWDSTSGQEVELTKQDVQLLWNSLFKKDSQLCFSLNVLTQIDELYKGRGNYGVKIRLPIKSTGTITEQGVLYNGEFTPVRRVEELPVASAKTMNALYLIFEDAENVVYEGVEGDSSTIISNAIYDFDYSPYDTITFVGGNYEPGHGNSWQLAGDTATVINPSEGDTFIIKSDGGRYAQGTYVFTATGIKRTQNNWNHCGIFSITGHYSTPQLHTYITALEDDEYKWQRIDYVVDENDLISQIRTQDIYDYQDIVVFDTNTMLGNPYSYEVGSNQKFYVSIDPDTQYVNYSELEEHPVKISTFVDDNWGYPQDYIPSVDYDVEFSKVQIYEVKPVPDEYKNGYYFILTAPDDGTLFVDNTGTITLKPLLRYRMKEVELSPENYFCYWFKKNSSITADSPKYLFIGGRGWEVLNGKDDNTGEYDKDDFEYVVKSSDIYLQGEYKCILVPTNNIAEGKTPETVETGYYEAEITLNKLNTGISVELTSVSEEGICSPTSNVILEATVIYEAAEEPKINFNYSRYNPDKDFIEESFGQIIAGPYIENVEEKTLTNVYTIKQKYQFSAGIIATNSYNTIVCSFSTVNDEGQNQDIGTDNVIIRVGNDSDYILNTYGDAFYKYDEYGNAPTLDTYAGSGSRVVQITPLNFEIINSNGEEEDYVGWTFTWGFPKESLITVNVEALSDIYDFSEDDTYYYFTSNQPSLKEITYEIENRYDKTKAENNVVLLKLTNGTKNLVGNIPITLTKDGLAGTNGSNYSAVVLARINNTNISGRSIGIGGNTLGTWPPQGDKEGYEYGELVPEVGNLPAKLQAFYYAPNNKWYIFFPNWMTQFEGETKEDWINNNFLEFANAVPTFKVRVMKEGKEISPAINTQSGSTTNGYTVEWSMLTGANDSMSRDSNTVVNFQINANGVLSVKTEGWVSGKTYFNIVQAKIKVANAGLVGDDTANHNFEYLYAYYPIEITKLDNANLFPTSSTVNLFPQLSGGFNEVIYRSDGLDPSYVNNENFTLNNYNEVSENKDLFEYSWTTSRNLYLTNEAETQAEYIDDVEERTDVVNQVTRVIKPVSNFDNGITANYIKVSYDKDIYKEADLVDELSDLDNYVESLYEKIAYIKARRNALIDKARDLKRFKTALTYERHSINTYMDWRYSLFGRIAYPESALNNEFNENTSTIIGYIHLIVNFLNRYFDTESSHLYLKNEMLNECNGNSLILKNHYRLLKLLNEDATALENISMPHTLSTSYPFVDSDFKNGVTAQTLQSYIERCNILITNYNTIFTWRANDSDFVNSFSAIRSNLVSDITEDSLFTEDQTITFEDHASIVINLSTDYNPIESELFGENVTDYFINKNLIKVLESYGKEIPEPIPAGKTIEDYEGIYDNIFDKYQVNEEIIAPLTNLSNQTTEQQFVYADYITEWENEITECKARIEDITAKINYINNNLTSAITHIKPILFITNTAEFGMLHGWDGVSANVTNDPDVGECLYQPQVGAGEWDQTTNSFKGLILGVKKSIDSQGGKHFMRGMFGYGPNQQGGSGSQQTLLLNSDTGQMILGDRLASRITIDPHYTVTKLNGEEETRGAIYSGNFFAEYEKDGTWMPTSYADTNEAHAGMMIDLSTPEIRFGNGNFELDSFGNLYAAGEGQIAAWNLKDDKLTSNNIVKGNQSMTLLSGKKAVYWTTSKVNPQPLNNISELPSYSSGEITYDINDQHIQKDEFGQPMAVLIKKRVSEGIDKDHPSQTARTRTILRKVYVDDSEHVPAIYSNSHDAISDTSHTGFYLSQEGLSILGHYYPRAFDSQGIETQGTQQSSRIEINTTEKPMFFSGSRSTLHDNRNKGFYIGEDGISIYNTKYYKRKIGADGAYEKVTIGTSPNQVTYDVYEGAGDTRLVLYFNDTPAANRYEFRVLDSNNNITSTCALPVTKNGGGIYLSVDETEMPSLYSKPGGSLSSANDGFYLSDCGFSLGSKFKVTQEGITYIGYNAVNNGGVQNGKFWTINGNSSNSYISYNDNKLYNYRYTVVSDEEKAIPGISPADEGWYKIVSGEYQKTTKVTDNHVVPGTTYYKRSFDFNTTSVYFGTDGIRLGKTFLVDKDNKFLYFGNLTSSTRYWTLNGDSGNAYLAYNCVGTRQNGTSVYSDLGSCVYEDEQKYYTNSSGSQYVTSIAYRINGAGDDSEADPSEYGDTDAASPDDKNATYDAKETVQIDDEREGANTDKEDSEVTTYRIENNKSVYFGTNGIRIGKHFGVNPQGQAVIKAGTIGNWTVNNNKIMSVLTPYNPQGTKKSNRKYLIELDAKDGLSCYQLNYKNENYYAVTPWAGVRPVDEGWYEKSGNNYILTSDTQAVTGKTYYEKGQIWKKKTQWYIKSNGRAYFRKLQIKKGEENYIELINGTVGNFTATSSGLSGGSISSATSIAGSSCSFSSSSLGSASSSSLNTTTLTVSGTSSFGGELSAYSGTRRCIDLVPNTSCGMSLTSLGCYIGPVLTDGSISTDYKVMTRAEVVNLINTALDGLSLTPTSATQNTSPDFVTSVSVTNPNRTGSGGSGTDSHSHTIDDPDVDTSKSSINYISSALSSVTLNKPHIS